MTEPMRNHQFTSPTVREVVGRHDEPNHPPEPRQSDAVDQRQLVAASLSATPRRD
jgi:hypothetical protein